MSVYQSSVIAAIEDELWRQDDEHGRNRDMPLADWISLILEELGEVATASNDGDYQQAHDELVQTAALCIQAAAMLERPKP